MSIHLCVYVYLQIRSETIATYALCGFANFSSLGIVVGALSKWKEYSSTPDVMLSMLIFILLCNIIHVGVGGMPCNGNKCFGVYFLSLLCNVLGWPKSLFSFFNKIKDTLFIFTNNFIDLNIFSTLAVSHMV